MSPTSPLRGVLAMLAAVAMFSLMDAGLKWLAPHYPPLQVGAMRGAASLPLVLVWALGTVGPGALLRVRWPLHFARGLLSVLMIGAFTYALRTMSLATAYSVFFVAPLLIVALSVPLLGERVGPRRWTAIVMGLAGVLIVLRPSGDGLLGIGGVMMLAAAVGYALSSILVRVLSRSDTTQSMVVWMLAMLTVGAGLLAWPQWQPLRSEHLPALAVIGVAGALGQVAVTLAFRHAEASLVAPLEYTALIWAVGLDRTLWHTTPDRMTLAGAAVIIVSGLYLIRREKVHAEAEHP